jgi:hypothetical protein
MARTLGSTAALASRMNAAKTASGRWLDHNSRRNGIGAWVDIWAPWFHIASAPNTRA